MRPLLGFACLMLGAGCAQDAGVASVLVVAKVEVTPPSGAVVLGQTLQLTATPKTEGGIPLPVHNVSWSSTDNATATVSPDGLVTGHSIGGPVRIRATVEGVTGETQITVLPVPVDHVIVTPATSTIFVGQQWPLTATAYDASNAVLTGRTFTWSSAASAIADVTTTGLVLGMAPGGPVQITAVAEGKSASAAVTVVPRPTRLGFLQQPSAAVAGQVLAPPIQVAVQDDALRTVTSATNSVTLALAGNPGSATLTGTKTVAAVNGIATFSNLVLNRTGTGYTLVATATGLTAATSSAFGVTAGAPTQLTFTTAPPATARSGIALTPNPVLQLRDGLGNAAPVPGVQITVAISGAGATLGGATAAATDASGAATFAGLTITGPIGSYTLTFSAPGLPPLASGAIGLTGGSAATIGITTQPSTTARSGIALARQPVVQLFDASGNTAPQAGVAITATIESGPAGGTLTGATTIATSATGVGTFTNLVLGGPAGSYTLRFSTPGLPAAISNPVVLSPGTPAALALPVQPSASAANGQAFARQPVVQLVDATGSPVSQAGVAVSVGLSGVGGTLGGVSTLNTDASGRAAFAGLSITGKTGNYALVFSSAGLSGVTSATIALGAGPATQLTITTQPSATATGRVPFAQQPVVQAQDASGNAVSGASVTAAIASGGGSLGGSATAITDVNGVAAFSDLSISGPAGVYTLGFTTPGVSQVVSSPIVVSVGAASQLVITTQPASTAQSGVMFPRQPVVQVTDASGNPVSGVLVDVAIASGGGTLGGTTTATSNANGIAAFTSLSISGTIGVRTLGFTASGTPQATSNGIDLTAGPAAQLVIVQEPSSNANQKTPFPQQPIVQLLDAAGNPVAGVQVKAALNFALGGGKLSGARNINTDAAGLATFTDLEIDKVGFYILEFSSGHITVVSSVTIFVQ